MKSRRWFSRRLGRPNSAKKQRTTLRFMTLEDRVNPAPLYPDLHALSSYLSGWTINNTGGNTRELAYATGLANGGQGAFDLRATSTVITDPDGTLRQLVNQRVYQSGGGFVDQFAGYFVYHPTHGHMHFDDMAWGQLRIRTPGNGLGDVVAVGPKTSFCLIDINHYNPSLPGSPTNSVYNSCNNTFQGISVGWNDVYGSSLDGQQIDVTGLPNGDYWLEVVVDPMNHIQEGNEENNTTRIPITITTLPATGFQILNSSVVGAQNNPVGFVDFTFNMPVNPATFTPSVVTFNGPSGAIPITSVTAQSTTTFRVNFAEQTSVGTYTMSLAPTIQNTSGQLLNQNNNGVGGEPGDTYINIFTITPPRVLSVSPSGAVNPPITSIRVTYNKPMQSSTFTLQDIASFTGPGGTNLLSQIAAITPVVSGGLSAAFDITFTSNLTTPGGYSMVIEPTVLDQGGNPVDQNGDGQSNSADRFTANLSIQLPNTVGPDAFGYDGVGAPVQNLELVGQTGTTPITFSSTDDAFAPINLGTNTFNFYGTTYTGNNQMFVSTNGLITFGAGSLEYDNSSGLSNLPVSAIAVLWDDWVRGALPHSLYKISDTNGDGTNDRLVIEWNQVQHHSGSGRVTFMVALDLNTGATPGGIFFNFPDLTTNDQYNNGVSATVGLHKAGPGKPHDLIISHNGSNSLVGNQKAVQASVPRVASITRVDPQVMPAGDMEYLVTFDHGVTGVDISDFTLSTSGNIAGAFVDHIHATADPAVYEVHVFSGSGTGFLKLNLVDNDSILSIGGAKLGGAGLGNGNFDNGEVYAVIQSEPGVQGVNIGDGTDQRSSIRLFQVIFDRVVTFANNDPAAAFVITGPNGTVTPTVDLSLSTPQQTVVRLTFSGNGTQWGSLMDGNYTARVVAANISTGGINMAADHVTNFHRLFGDVNGDKQVDGFDFSAFSGAYNTTTGNPAYRASLDVNGDGVIDGFDFSHFSGRYGTMLP
jgi:hypothetical protein